jgi:hypothetical protein
MPQYLREVLAANEYTTAHNMAVATDRVWDLRQSAPPSPLPRFPNPVSGPPRRANAAGMIAATPTATAHRAITAVGTRHHTHRNSLITKFVGITTNSRIVQINAKLPVISRCQVGKWHVLPLGHSAPVGGNRRVPYQIHTATAMSFSHSSGLMFLRDSYNKLNFLVDSGASLSIIPFSSSQTPLGPKLLGANGASIPT